MRVPTSCGMSFVTNSRRSRRGHFPTELYWRFNLPTKRQPAAVVQGLESDPAWVCSPSQLLNGRQLSRACPPKPDWQQSAINRDTAPRTDRARGSVFGPPRYRSRERARASREIGRASCRERGGTYGSVRVVAGSFKTKKKNEIKE